MIKARNLDPASALRYVDITDTLAPSTASVVNAIPLGVWMFPARYPVNLTQAQSAAAQATGFGKIVDVLIAQAFVGAGGTSVAVNLLKNGTTIFATQPVIALASGAVALDTAGVLAVPTGATRGIFATTAGLLNLKKGDILSYTTTVTGAYTTAPNLAITIVIDSAPV